MVKCEWEIAESDEGTVVLTPFITEIDHLRCANFRQMITKALELYPRLLVVDLTAITYLAVPALGILLDLKKEAERSGTDYLVVTGETVWNILCLTKLDQVITTSDSFPEGVQTPQQRARATEAEIQETRKGANRRAWGLGSKTS